MSPGQGYHSGLAGVLLIPINEVIDRPAGLNTADDEIMRIVVDYMKSHGLDVEQVNKRAYRRAYGVAVREAQTTLLSGESATASQDVEFSDVLPLLMSELDSDAQLVVIPSVVMRSGDYSGGKQVRWDGVRRRERGVRGAMSGTTQTASIHIVIYRPDGTRLFSGYGGLDLLFELNMQKRKYQLRDDRLQDEENLAEGVCIAFHPFFGDDADC